MKITVVCPTLNESENVPELIRELENVLAGIDYEIIIADDDSPDGTWAVAEQLGKSDPRIHVVRRQGPRSLGWSVIDAFTVARGDVLACMDADLQHDPAILPRMLQQLENGADLVVGSRYVAGGSSGQWRLQRKLESWLATRMAGWFTGVKIRDPMSGYFILRRADFLRVREQLDGRGFKILLEIASNMPQVRIVEVPFAFRKRRAGRSKLSRKVVLAYLAQLWRLHRRKQSNRMGES